MGEKETKRLVVLGCDDGIAEPDDAAFEHFSDEATAIVEHLLEVAEVPGEAARSLAWIAVLHTAEAYLANLEFTADEPHELDASREDVAP